jgi:hypothetical protein
MAVLVHDLLKLLLRLELILRSYLFLDRRQEVVVMRLDRRYFVPFEKRH